MGGFEDSDTPSFLNPKLSNRRILLFGILPPPNFSLLITVKPLEGQESPAATSAPSFDPNAQAL